MLMKFRFEDIAGQDSTAGPVLSRNPADNPLYVFLLSSLTKLTLTTIIMTANTSDAISCPIAAAGIGCNGHGSMKLARHALNIQTTVRKK